MAWAKLGRLVAAVALALALQFHVLLPTRTQEGLDAQAGVVSSVDEALSRRWGDLTLPRAQQLTEATHLVVVAGHSVFQGTDYATAFDDQSQWHLQDYQRRQWHHMQTHMRRGVEVAAGDPRAALVFSGGETAADSGPRSEAQSYFFAAQAKGWFGWEEEIKHRVFTEEQARDSFENLLFAICRFREITGQYPEEITVVSFSFKRERFVNEHRKALRFPAEQFHFTGSDHDGDPSLDQATRDAFAADPYGCLLDGDLWWKKVGRNQHRVHPGYPAGCPDLRALFDWCETSIFPGPLPWSPSPVHA